MLVKIQVKNGYIAEFNCDNISIEENYISFQKLVGIRNDIKKEIYALGYINGISKTRIQRVYKELLEAIKSESIYIANKRDDIAQINFDKYIK